MIVIAFTNKDIQWIESKIIKAYGEEIRPRLYRHYFSDRGYGAYAWFIDKPDECFQNYIAQMKYGGVLEIKEPKGET